MGKRIRCSGDVRSRRDGTTGASHDMSAHPGIEQQIKHKPGLSVEAVHHRVICAWVLDRDAGEQSDMFSVRVEECISRKGPLLMNTRPPLGKRCVKLGINTIST